MSARTREFGLVTDPTIEGPIKDDQFFAGQAIGRDSNASLPAFPVSPALADR